MIDIEKAKKTFKNFLNNYNKNELGFELKIVHTYHVVDNAKEIATKLNLSEEDIKLAELIALLHDIGRLEEITVLKKFDSVKFDHASHGVKMLFENNLIRDFIEENTFAFSLAQLTYENCEEIDKIINEHSVGWKVERLPKVSLAIMRLALCEILYVPSIPNGVSINEAVELAKKFSSQEDASFINGVLGKYVRENVAE